MKGLSQVLTFGFPLCFIPDLSFILSYDSVSQDRYTVFFELFTDSDIEILTLLLNSHRNEAMTENKFNYFVRKYSFEIFKMHL